jgi:hypothetical protein
MGEARRRKELGLMPPKEPPNDSPTRKGTKFFIRDGICVVMPPADDDDLERAVVEKLRKGASGVLGSVQVRAERSRNAHSAWHAKTSSARTLRFLFD